MADAMKIALTGMRAAENRVAVSADNIANMRSSAPAPKSGEAYAGYTPKRVDNTSQSSGGVRTGFSPVDPAYVLEMQNGSVDPVAQPNVDLANEQIQLMSAEKSYKFNADVIRTQEEMDQALLDIKS